MWEVVPVLHSRRAGKDMSLSLSPLLLLLLLLHFGARPWIGHREWDEFPDMEALRTDYVIWRLKIGFAPVR